MMNTKTYHAVLMDTDFSVTGEIRMGGNPRYLVVVDPTQDGALVLGSDEEPDFDDVPFGSFVFRRVASAVWVDDEASSMYEYLGEKWT